MKIVCFGLSHQSASLDLLENLAFGPDEMERLLLRLGGEDGIEEVAGISTCNRTEFYFVVSDATVARDRLLRILPEYCPYVPMDDVRKQSYLLRGEKAVRHVFRVASGVDSLIVGEAQILGQLRRAYELSNSAGSVGEHLHGLLQRAVTFGRRIRVETDIARGNVSLASISCRLAAQVAGPLREKAVLLLGAGETAELAGRSFAKEGVRDLMVLNRSRDKALAMAQELGGRDVAIDRLLYAVEQADVVVCAVSAPHYVITKAGLEEIAERRPDRPILMIDLSMPRNIDREVTNFPNVELYAIEDLEEIAHQNRRQREAEIEKVEELLNKETASYYRWLDSSAQNKLVTHLRRHVEAIRLNRLARYHARLSEEEWENLDALTDSVMRAVFHDASRYIRSLDLETEEGRRDYEVIYRLFNLGALEAVTGPEEGRAEGEAPADSAPEKQHL